MPTPLPHGEPSAKAATAVPTVETAKGPAPAFPSEGLTLPGRDSIFAPFSLVNYRWYFFIGLCISSSFGMQSLAFSWLMYELTGKPVLVGLNLLAQAVPQICLAFVGGVVADRFSKRLIMMFTFTTMGSIFLVIGVAQVAGILTWPWLAAASFGMGGVTSFQMPSRQGIITQLVGRDRLTAAIAMNQANMNVTQLAAPAAAGILIAANGIGAVFFAMAGLCFIGVLGLFPIRYTELRSKSRVTIKAMFANLAEGLKYVQRNGNVRGILVLSLLGGVFAMPYTVLLPVLAKDVLHADAQRLGFLLSASGVGALFGSLLLVAAGKRKRGLLLIHTAFVSGLALVSLSFSPWYTLTFITMAVLGVANSARNTLPNILVQSYTEDAYLGRVLSLLLLQFGITSVGGFGMSVVAQIIGVQWALFITAICLITTSLWYYRFSASIKSLA